MAEGRPWIAIVDDDPGVLRALGRLVRSRGHRVKIYGSGREFLEDLPNGRPDCLIVDFQMPGMSGLELSQYLMKKGIVVPTILITAHSDALTHSSSGREAFVARLQKPLQDDVFLTAIGRAISGYYDG